MSQKLKKQNSQQQKNIYIIESRSKIGGIKQSFYGKVNYRFTFASSFQYYKETFERWVKEQREGIVIDYDLVKINDHKSHSFYTVSSLEEFAKMLNT